MFNFSKITVVYGTFSEIKTQQIRLEKVDYIWKNNLI